MLQRLVLCVCVFVGLETVAHAQPVLSQGTAPQEIAPSGTSLWTFVVDNRFGAPTTAVGFTATLPPGVTLASPARTTTNCVEGVVTGSDGGNSLALSGARIGAGAQCTVSAQVTSELPGSYVIESVELTSSSGSFESTAGQLNVDPEAPSFTATFSDATIEWGETTRLEFAIGPMPSGFYSTQFLVPLDGARFAEPTQLRSDCFFVTPSVVDGTLRVDVGAFNAEGQFCTVALDIVPNDVGPFAISTTELNSFSPGNSGFATAGVLVQRAGDLHLVYEFLDDPVIPGESVRARFTIWNFHRTLEASAVTVTADLDGALSGLTAVGLPIADACGAGSEVFGDGQISLAGGTIPAESFCEFEVVVQVPAGADMGEFSSSTSALAGMLGGSAVTGNEASATLIVSLAPTLDMALLSSPVVAGDSFLVEFTLTNPSTVDAADNIQFSSDVAAFLSATELVTAPAPGFCGPGSQFTTNGVPSLETMGVLGASLAANESCTFSAELRVPLGTTSGERVLSTGEVSATVRGQTQISAAARESLRIVGSPKVTKAFSAERVRPGDAVSLTYVLSLDENAPTPATEISFVDDYDEQLAGLVATSVPSGEVCGAGSQLTGTDALTLTGATLAPNETCTFTVTLEVPPTAATGAYPSATSHISAIVDGLSTSGLAAEDELLVSELLFEKEFLPNPVRLGQTITLEYRLENISGEAATGIFFSDSLSQALPGLAPPNATVPDACGAGSQLQSSSGGSVVLIGGALGAGESCAFAVTLSVPSAVPLGVYTSTTSSMSASFGGSATTIPPASDSLIVADPLLLTASFAEERATSGGTVTLEFLVANSDATEAATGLSFTNDLGAALDGLVAVGLPISDVCGAGSVLSGTEVLTLTGGQVDAGQTCSFSVTLQVPGDLSSGSEIHTVTSELTGTMGGAPVTAPGAEARLQVDVLAFSANFTEDGFPGELVSLAFAIENLQTTEATGLRFANDLGTMIAGATASELPADGFCGAGSSVTGSSDTGSGAIAVRIPSLAAGASCSFTVQVAIPRGVVPGDYSNTTSELTLDGLVAASAAQATLTVRPIAPTLVLSLAPPVVDVASPSRIRMRIDNTANGVPMTGLTGTVALPDGLQATSDVVSDCGGEVDVNGSTVSLVNGLADEGSECAISFEAAAPLSGNYEATATLTTVEAGDSAPSTASVLVLEPLVASAEFSPKSGVDVGEASTLQIVIRNDNANAAPSLALGASLPAGLAIATSGAPESDCGGQLAATAGATTFALAGGLLGADASCTVTVPVVADAAGGYEVVVTASSAGVANATASAKLDVGGSGCGCSSTGSQVPVHVALFGVLWIGLSLRRRRSVS